MPKTNIPVGKVMSKPRSQWGTVIPRYDDSGSLSAWQVRYPNPVDHGKKVQKQFKPHQEHEAHVWLENEHHLVDLHTKGIQTWVHPRDRMRWERANQMMFKGVCRAMGRRIHAAQRRTDSRRNQTQPVPGHRPFHARVRRTAPDGNQAQTYQKLV